MILSNTPLRSTVPHINKHTKFIRICLKENFQREKKKKKRSFFAILCRKRFFFVFLLSMEVIMGADPNEF
jgi:hypothetical protein